MKVFTAHTRPSAAPVLLREGWSWGAAIFGPLWLLLHRAWVAAAIVVLLVVAAAWLPPRTSMLAAIGLGWCLGLFGQDILRWTLARRGFVLAHVVAAPDGDTALARLLDRRPDLVAVALR